MGLHPQVLGWPGRDNALFVRAELGHLLRRFLFDCGQDCTAELPLAEVQAVDYLCFSHLHMDHVGGFDPFFRATFERPQPIVVWGPPGTARILHHRFQGYLWNMPGDGSGTWLVHEVHPGHLHTYRFELPEAFTIAHDEGTCPTDGLLLETEHLRLEAMALDHRTPSLAYLLREKPRRHVDAQKLQALGLPSGAWIKQLKEPSPGQRSLEVEGRSYDLEALRAELLTDDPGDSVAYLTDFLLDEAAMRRLVPWLEGVRTLVCESQYRHADLELARKNYHLTSVQAAQLAKEAGVGELVLFHLSDRYASRERSLLLHEAQAVFPNTRFPEHWNLR
jgi:ribonuclease Z